MDSIAVDRNLIVAGWQRVLLPGIARAAIPSGQDRKPARLI